MSHPIIGVWAVETKYDNRPRVDRGTLLFHADATASFIFSEFSAHAVWQATGERNATLSATRPVGPNEGYVGWYTLSGVTTVADDGMSITIKAVQSRPRPDGSLVEQRATVTGSRLLVQPPSTSA